MSASGSGAVTDLARDLEGPRRGGEGTSPEELIAGRRRGRVLMALAAGLARAGDAADEARVRSDDDLRQGRRRLRHHEDRRGIRGQVDGIDLSIRSTGGGSEGELPVSQALKGNVEISVVLATSA